MNHSIRPGRPFFGAIGRRRTALVALAALAPLTLAACGQDADATDVVTVDLQDFAFGDLPEEVPAGTEITAVNSSEAELHELVALRLPDDEQRAADEIVHDGLEQLLAAGPPALVLLAPPGGEPTVAVGDGTLAEPGRYLILCAIPTGADPAEYLAAAAASNGEQPQVEGGAPHFTHGMFDDLVVE